MAASRVDSAVAHPDVQVSGDWTNGVKGAVKCSDGKFFDPAGLQCLTCGTNASVDASGLGCECAAGQYLAAGTGTSPYATCTSCIAVGKAVSWDNTTCMPCDAGSGATLSTTTGDCACSSGATHVLVETDASGVRLASKQCVACAAPSFPHPTEKGKCFECPYAGPPSAPTRMTYDSATKTCKCPTGVTACIDADVKKASLVTKFGVTLDSTRSSVRYFDLGASLNSLTVESLVFLDDLVDVAAGCRDFGNRTQCNALANLCVLQMYDTTTAACKLYNGIVSERKANEYHSGEMSPAVGWSETMPWLYYTSGTDYAGRTDLGTVVTFDAPGSSTTEVSELQFVLSVTTLSGEWLGFRPVGKLLQLCGGREQDLTNWQRFGTNYFNDCTLPVAEALDAARAMGKSAAGETLFFDLYIQDLAGAVATANVWPESLYPVPINVANIPVNKNALASDDIAVRRFFVIDETAGVAAAGKAPKAVTYAQTISLMVRIRTDEKSRLFPPSLSITYAQRDPSYAYTSNDAVSFRVLYTMATDKFWETWEAIFIAFMVIAGVQWMYGVMQVSRRRQTRDPDAKSLMHALGTAAGAMASAFTIILFCGSGYYFLFFKAQTEVYTMVPLDTDTEVTMFKVLLNLAVACAAIGLTHTVYWQCNYDIFFLDWEKSRATLTPAGKATTAPVSTWRQFFIANEWNELQTKRVTDRSLTLLLMILFLLGLDLQNLGVMEPSMSTSEPAPYQVTSVLLRFAVGGGLMLFIGFCQMAYKIVFHHNYVCHPIQQFVDLLSLSNVSIVILDDECSGYYIHGRSLMAFTDTSMAELSQQMRKEQEMQVSARGLVPSSTRQDLAENQCFEIFITKELRMAYETKLLRRIQEQAAMNSGGGFMGSAANMMGGGRGGYGGGYGQNGGAMGGVGGFGRGMLGPSRSQGGGDIPQERTIAAAEEIADIFKQLINFTEANAASYVLERPFTDRLLNMPPETVSMMQGASPVFYHDFRNAFSRVLFYGIEFQLLVFDILVFCALDAETGSFAVAAFLTWIIGSFVDYVRASFGEANISRKSLIDERFLI